MRPLKLRLQGLRSYRTEQEVDFEDVSLVAIVGDTGAGKSSLLEALTVALYGTSTWDGKEIKQLVSDGAQTMQVGLTFRADGKVWKVERAISRGNYPPPRHSLECPETGERIDKKDAVDARIRQLVGLDYDAFLRSVVLPQGRFAALLQAKQAERASILKGILRIDRLDTVREEAREARDRIVPVLDGLRERRSKLLPDPAAAEIDAQQRLSVAETQRAAVAQARETVARAKERARAAEARKKQLEALLGRAAEGRVADAEAIFRALSEREAEIAAVLARTEAELAQKKGEEEELTANIEEAEKKGAGPVSLAAARNGLAFVAEELPLLAADGAAVEKEDAAVAKETADLDKAEGMLAQLTATEAEAKKALGERQGEAKRAAEALESGRRLLKDVRTAEAEEAKAAKKAEKAKADLEKAKADLEAALAEGKKARAKLDEAEAASQASAQKHAAHRAAEGAKPGDPCPVCERALPDDWKPARAPAIEAAQKKLEKAKKDHETAREKWTAAKSKEEAAREKADEATADLAERAAHSASARKALSDLLPGASAAADDAVVLAGAAQQHEAATRALGEAEAHAQKARDVVIQAKAALDAAKKRLKERRDALKKSKDALAARRKRFDETLKKLPDDLRPQNLGLAAPGTGGGAAEQASAAQEIASLVARVELRKLKIERVVKDLEEARAARRVLEMERSRLGERRQAEVTAKAGDLDVRLATYADRLHLLAEAMSAEPPAPRPDRAPLADLADWAADFERRADELLMAGEEAVAAARTEGQSAEQAASRALADAGADSEAALDAALSRAEGHRAAAKADLDKARAQKPIAAALDERIERAQSLSLALGEVTRLVADGKLIHHVVHRRQRVLLSVASELLGSMTRSRYGFSEDFEVVDKVSGQARGTRTLSGGETFLASLSLSLALVELAGRAGGRLEALFLDEGFGSLDASSLSEALDALTQKAEGGRLVAVISHLKSVAESIDKVLSVKMSPTGSRVAWISSEEREKLLAEDVERGLLT